uniref:Uncharacterized protein n=1 Tax=Romanomermis culicivorax TaxID=13658 RepID=A0A915IJ41_ROMCU
MQLRLATRKALFRLRVTCGPQFLKVAKNCAGHTVFRPLRTTMPTALRPKYGLLRQSISEHSSDAERRTEIKLRMSIIAYPEQNYVESCVNCWSKHCANDINFPI